MSTPGGVPHDAPRGSALADPISGSKSLSPPVKPTDSTLKSAKKRNLSVQLMDDQGPDLEEAAIAPSLSSGSASSSGSDSQPPGMNPYEISIHRASDARRATMANFVPTVSGRIRRSIASIRQSAVLRGELLRHYMAGNVQNEVEWRHRVGYFVFTKKWLLVLTVTYLFEVAWFTLRPSNPCSTMTLTYLNILFMVARKATGENKRRFISYEHDFDLDLCYINPRLLAMSVPSTGLMQLYRNPVSEVARFLHTFHKASYKIVNMCPELPYKLVNPVGCPVLCPPWSIGEDAVHCFDIQDHTPPTLRQFVDFLNLGKEWAIQQDENVLIVHCRGGKGRTGSFCCAWLLYRQEAEDAEDALNFFAIRRTDMWVSKKVKSQGVETASQRRYIHYVWQLLKSSSTYFPQDIEQVTRKPAKLNKLILEGMWKHSVSEVVVIVQDRLTTNAVFISNFGFDHWDLAGIEVVGDIRISFVDVNEFWRRYPTSTLGEVYGGKSPPSSSWSSPLGQKPKKPPKFARAGTEPGCLAFFMVHTTFLPAEHGDGCLCFSKEQLDLGKFGKKKLNPEGFLYLEFSRIPTSTSDPKGSLEALGSTAPKELPRIEASNPGLLSPGKEPSRASLGFANGLSLSKSLSERQLLQPQQQAKRVSAIVPLLP